MWKAGKTEMSSRCRRAAVLLCLVLLGAWYLLRPSFFASDLTSELFDIALSRALCSAVFLLTLYELRTPLLRPLCPAAWSGKGGKSPLRAALICLPWLAVAVNNFPILPLIGGEAVVDCLPLDALLYVIGCLCIGLFEETAFRGLVFPLMLRRLGRGPKAVFLSIVATSGVFGLMHLVNLLEGGSPLGVLMQVGYSFLIGGMCAIALLKTGSIWPAVLLHGVYDVGGYLIDRLGRGEIWNAASIALTAAVAVLVAGYTVWMLTTVTEEEVRRIVGD